MAAMAGDCGKPNILVGTLKVDNVQALASAGRSKLTDEILQRYIRPEIDSDSLASHDDSIPIIDLQRLSDMEFSKEENSKLKFACEEWGFFQLINHGISEQVIEKAKTDIEEFFQLPFEVKEAVAQAPGSNEGYGQTFVLSKDQKLDWGDMYFLYTQPHAYRNLKLWPTHPPTFRETLDLYSLEVRRVAQCLLGFMSRNLGLEEKKLIDIFKEAQSIRMNYYPPCSHAEKVFGLTPHSDGVGLTLLLQVSTVEGLQIRRNGKWIPVKPLSGALIVNIGDILEIYTNGIYKSIEHRAVVHREKERISVAAFHVPKFGDVIGPLPELVKGGVEFYKTLSMDDYLKRLFSSKLDGKNRIDSLKLNV